MNLDIRSNNSQERKNTLLMLWWIGLSIIWIVLMYRWGTAACNGALPAYNHEKAVWDNEGVLYHVFHPSENPDRLFNGPWWIGFGYFIGTVAGIVGLFFPAGFLGAMHA